MINYRYFIWKIRNVFLPYKAFMLKSRNALTVGRLSCHNGNFDVSGEEWVTIGSFCAIGKNVSIITTNHDYNYTAVAGAVYDKYFNETHPGEKCIPPTRERTQGPVVIGNDVWIASNVTVLSGVTIGDGACVGNGSVVTKNVEPYTVVAGVPARPIKKRFSEDKIAFLMSLRWWDWDDRMINQNKKFFMSNLNTLELEVIKSLIFRPPPPQKIMFDKK
jgi:acetyltransferase-like isoleucine patch superfamily enzyme